MAKDWSSELQRTAELQAAEATRVREATARRQALGQAAAHFVSLIGSKNGVLISGTDRYIGQESRRLMAGFVASATRATTNEARPRRINRTNEYIGSDFHEELVKPFINLARRNVVTGWTLVCNEYTRLVYDSDQTYYGGIVLTPGYRVMSTIVGSGIAGTGATGIGLNHDLLASSAMSQLASIRANWVEPHPSTYTH